MMFTIPLWIKILMERILHHLMNPHPQLDPTYIMIAMALTTSVMSATMNVSPAWDLILILQIIPLISQTNI